MSPIQWQQKYECAVFLRQWPEWKSGKLRGTVLCNRTDAAVLLFSAVQSRRLNHQTVSSSSSLLLVFFLPLLLFSLTTSIRFAVLSFYVCQLHFLTFSPTRSVLLSFLLLMWWHWCVFLKQYFMLWSNPFCFKCKLLQSWVSLHLDDTAWWVHCKLCRQSLAAGSFFCRSA